MANNKFEEIDKDVDKRLDAIEKKYVPSSKVGFFTKLKVLFKPKAFYEKIKDAEQDLFGALKYVVIFLAIFSFLRIIAIEYKSASGIIDLISIPFLSFFIFIFYVIGLMAYLFIFIVILHLIVKVIGGKNPFHQTFKAFIYGFTPILLLGWFPNIYVLIPVLVYSLILQVIGISKLQEISYLRGIITSIWLPIATLFFFNFLTSI